MRVRIGNYPRDHTQDRNIRVDIEPFDIWNAGSTLAEVIHPLLVEFKEKKRGYPFIEFDDLPVEMVQEMVGNMDVSYSSDRQDGGYYEPAWDWVLDEMILAFKEARNSDEIFDRFSTGKSDFTFEPIDVNGVKMYEMKKTDKDTFEFDNDGYNAYIERLKNGRRLFAKYFDNLWD